ncbi:FAD-dependent monooxygenase [Acetobacter sp. TBRC 12305]|uniref:FAD-dependent monooxygenase n=1 Tax=Acetobacter garciniae TaxID=2817435 RepID=A0A939KLP9_9PROT|nr:FAD-dependent monooxygenase [Acetobacter garciniae]MBO1324473.1 FAD-dependent monooxygenase [Acetobacter garciniae]MBX0344162.1 FAD-dependent monooxygenase [Acetobacter garciniae]
MSKPVLVVGAGPVGLTMAAELARYRVPVRLIETLPARTDQSRALAVWSRTLELLDAAGCADAFVATGLHASTLGIHSGRQRLARVTFKGIASSFRYLLIIAQSETERLLEEHFLTLGGTIERTTELTGFVDTGEGVTCTLTHAGGESEHVDAGWLIGCDGAHSFVRRRLGLGFEGDTLPTGFIIADTRVAGLALPPDELAIFWHHDGAVMFFPISPGRYRIIADIGAAPPPAMDLGVVQAIVDRRGPGGVSLSDPLWLSHFGVNERKVRTYRAGRVFLAGDAAHIHSPAGGQGMNTGMQDAFNLAWKLALVVRGEARPDLLDSYSAERSTVAQQVLNDSGRITRVVLLKNRLARLVRCLVVRGLFRIPMVPRAIANRLAGTRVGYAHSPLNAGCATGLRGPRPGQRFWADHPLGRGDAPRFTLAATDTPDVRVIIARHAALLNPAPCPPPDKNGIWLVRPDGYVAAAARSADWLVIDAALARIAASPPVPERI